MKDLERVALLFDFYGPLLTERQQELIRAYFQDDLSLGEIAAWTGVSRQAVHDQIRRAEAALAELEDRLGLVAEHRRRQALVQALVRHLEAALDTLSPADPAHRHVLAAQQLAKALMAPPDKER